MPRTFPGTTKRKLDYMDDERSIWKYLFLDILTLGIYQHWCAYTISRDLGKLCKDRDEKLPKFWKYVVFSILTLGIYSIFWWLKAIDIITSEGLSRGIKTDISPGFFIVCYLLRYICSLAILVVLAKIFEAMNKLAADYNRKVRTMPPSYFENNAEATN